MSQTLANVTCIAINGRGVLIGGQPGSGKSSLALALIDRGAVLIGDDGVTLEVEPAPQDRLIASPAPNIAGLIEIRNVGIVSMPTTSAPLALAITLESSAPRLPEKPATASIAGVDLPHLSLFPQSSALALRVEWALRLYGRC